MKKIFTHENLITFAFVTAAVTVAALFVIPIAKKFIPASLLSVVTPAPATVTPAA